MYEYRDDGWVAADTTVDGDAYSATAPPAEAYAVGVDAALAGGSDDASERDAAGDDGGRDEPASSSLPGFGPIAALVAVVAAALLGRSRRR